MKEKSTQKVEKIKVRNSLVRCLLVHHDSILWIGGHAELIRYDIIHDRVLQVIKLPTICWSLKEDERGNIWAVTWTAGLFQFNKEGKLLRRVYGTGDASRPGPFDRTLSMTNSRHSGIKWLGYNGGGGFSKNEWTGKLIRSYKIPSKTPNQSTSNTITCIREDEQGDLWMGTYGGGIVHFDPDSRSFINYTQSDGLKGDFVNCVLEDDSSRLWISTSNGLCVLDTRRNSIIQPDIDLSFPSNDLVPNGTMLDNGRMIFFAGKKIVEIDPVSFLRSPISTQLLISSFKVFNDEKVLPGNGDQGEFRLRYNQNFFSFEYSLLKSNPNAPVQYAYMLEGFDRDWNYVKERKTAYFTNVPAGNYVFRVKAMDRTGQWAHYSHPVFLHIIAPFWQRWWFLVAVAAVIVTALYLFYRYRIGQVKKLFGLRTKISHDLHDEVASTLSGIRLYSELAKQQLANNESLQVKKSLDLIAVNASEMKEDMSDIIWAINPANDSFGKLLQKLKVYASETCAAAGIRFQLLTDEPIPAEKLTMEQRRNIYLICKEAINNAVKYSGARNIVLKVAQLERSVHIRITDDGKGFDPEITVNGNGVLNMQMRSKEIGANLEIQSRQGVGTDIEMFVKV